jgi:hypothetical protein
MAAQGRRSTLHDLLPGGPARFAVPVLRDAHDPVRRVLDPLELYHSQQMRRHWIHDPDPEDAALREAGSQDSRLWRRLLQDKRRRRASEDEELYGTGENVPPGSRPFRRQLQDARQRSQRLHTDETDLEGPGKFHDVRSATRYTRQLVVDDPTSGFKSGDAAALKPTPRGDGQDEHDERPDLDFCFVTGRAWQRGFVEVVFYSDRQVSAVKAERLAKISKAEVAARKRRFKAAAFGSSTTSDVSHGMPGLRPSGDAGRGAAPGQSLSLPGSPCVPRPSLAVAPGQSLSLPGSPCAPRPSLGRSLSLPGIPAGPWRRSRAGAGSLRARP